MKRIKTIHLEIDADKEAEFYASLYSYKTSEKSNMDDLKFMADAIHFDANVGMQIFVPSESEEKNINLKLLSIHEYLLQSGSGSFDYLKVSKKDFEEFKSSTFAMELYELIKMKEIAKKWIGKEESAEVKAGIAAYSYLSYYFTYHFADDMNYSFQPEIQEKIQLSNFQDQLLKGDIIENGNFQFKIDEQTKEFEFYIKQKDELLKTRADSKELNKIFDNKTGSFYIFIRSVNKAFRIKMKKIQSEVVYYENEEEKNNILDLINASITDAEITPITQLEEEKKSESIQLKELKFDKEGFASIFNPILEQVSFFLEDPKIRNKNEMIVARDKIVLNVYDSLQKHFNDLTVHILATITGYICSELELLQTEEQYDNSSKTQPYRKYLKDTVYNIVKKRSL